MPDPKALLRVKRIDTIGLVDRGDNPDAEIVFWKRDPGAPGTTPPANDPDAVRAAQPGTADEGTHMNELEKAQADLTAARAEVETLTAKLAEIGKAECPMGDRCPMKKAEKGDVLKGLSPEARAEVEAEMAKRDEKLTALTKAHDDLVEKGRRDALAIRFAKGGDLEQIGGEKRVDVLLKAQKALTPEDWSELEKTLKAASEQIAKGGLFKPAGADGEPPIGGTGTWAKIQAKANDMVAKKEAPTFAQAIAKIADTDPALYGEYVKEQQEAR